MNQGIELSNGPTRLTMIEVHRRAYDAMRDHRARTALDLTQVDTLRIVVSRPDYEDLRAEAYKTPMPRAHYDGLGRPVIGGITVIPDATFERGTVRLRTELEA